MVLLDDEAAVRRGLRLRLELEPDIEVVGDTGDVASAIDAAVASGADVMVLDGEITAPGVLDAAARSVREAPATHVIVLSLRNDDRMRADALGSGALALVSKTGPDSDLVNAIRSAATTAAQRPGGQS